uniref:protein-serine/threonine phosphatase n=1 Tax=Ciona savignyi TaxID=51511 RepID=H2Z631_CIOSA
NFFAGELQTHLHAIFHHLREQDSIKLAVRLESWNEEHRRYLVIVSTTGRQDTEENIIVGCDFPTKESKVCTIGLVLPIWCDTTIQLDGDGGYKVLSHEKTHTFKPVSVQAMWSALQALHKCKDTAQKHNYYEGSLFLTWTCYYTSKIKSNRVYINEWEYSEDLWTRKPNYFEMKDAERVSVETLIRDRLKQVMMTMDLDNCTCKQVRLELENVIDMDLTAYKRYIDTEMFNILGQMDCPTKILDYLYLGSGWNASNLEELERFGVRVDNFFPDDFTYKNIRLHDLEASNLLQHWHGTWRFIDQARRSEGKCLVHCKMGISRSSATVAAYLMKERLWTKKKALEFVVGLRSIAHPNPAFLDQLDEYEGMVFAR